jgi:hypothetical protein
MVEPESSHGKLDTSFIMLGQAYHAGQRLGNSWNAYG